MEGLTTSDNNEASCPNFEPRAHARLTLTGLTTNGRAAGQATSVKSKSKFELCFKAKNNAFQF